MDGSAGKYRWLRLSAVLGTTALTVAACGGSSTTATNNNNMAPAAQQILRTNSGTEPNSFDPGQETYDYEGLIGRNVFEPLLKPTTDLKDVTGAGASSFDVSSDGLTYTFHLRTNAKWSDGQPVKASDWVYGYQRLLDPSLAAGYVDPYFDAEIAGAQTYGSVDANNKTAVASFIAGLGLSAPDDHTFVIKLSSPAGYFKWVVTLWVATPIRKDIVDKNGYTTWSSTPTNVIGNGAFKISEEVPKDHVTLVPNSYYWGAAPHIQKWIDYFIEDANQAFSKYQTGELDMLNVPLSLQDSVTSDPNLSKQEHKYPSLNTFWLAFNLHQAPFDNVHVREAVSRAIDRNTLVNQVAKGTYSAVQTFIPNGMNGYTPALGDAQAFDPTKAKAALAASGLPVSAYDTVKFLTRNTTTNQLLNQYFVNQINTNLGVHWTLQVVDSKTVTGQYLRKGKFQIYGSDGWGADYPDEQDWFDIYETGGCHGTNWGCPNDSNYDSIVGKADAALRQSDRQALYDQAAQIMENNYWVDFLYNRTEVVLVKPYVAGMVITPIDEGVYLPGDFHTNSIYITNH